MQRQRTFNIELLLVGILVLGAVVRYWGLNFGLPHNLTRPDEQHYVLAAMQLLNGDRSGYFYEYPSLFFYLLAGAFVLYYALGRLFGRFGGLEDFIYEYATDQTMFHLIPRAMSAFAGVATIYAVYKTMRRLFQSEKTGLLGGFFMALCYLHVRDSHFGTMDVTMTFFIIASFHFIVKSYDEWSLKNYLLAGLLAGLAMSTKYAGVFLIVPIGILHLLKSLEHKMPFRHLIIDKRILGFGLALVLGFLAGTPHFLTEYSAYAERVFNRFDLMDTQSPSLGVGWWYHLKFSLWHGLGWGMYLAAFAGMVLYFRRDWRRALILFSFPLTYYWFAGKGHTVFLRYMIPILPFLCMAAANFVFEVYHFFKKRFSYHLTVSGTGLLIAIIIFQGTYNLVQFSQLIVKEDSRQLGKDWMLANVQPGSSVYQYANGSNFCKVQLPPTIDFVENALVKARSRGESGRVDKARLKYLQDNKIQGYRQFSYQDSLQLFAYNGTFTDSLPDYILLHEYPLIEFMPPPDYIQRIVEEQYQLVHQIQTVNSQHAGNRYDQHDAFFLPFAGFYETERLGNNMKIYGLLVE